MTLGPQGSPIVVDEEHLRELGIKQIVTVPAHALPDASKTGGVAYDPEALVCGLREVVQAQSPQHQLGYP